MKNNLSYRVDQLEKNYCDLDGKVELILTNHLPHIREEILVLGGKVDSLRTRVSILSLVNVGAIILGLLLGKIL